MQIMVFTVPVGDSGAALSEMNTFLRGHKILEVDSHLVSNKQGAYWSFCVRYMEQFGTHSLAGDQRSKEKIDYMKVLDADTFKRFSELRSIRKKVAIEAGIAAYIVFTDEELAALAKLEEITEQAMLGIKGIGEKKVERFAKYFIDEAHGQPN